MKPSPHCVVYHIPGYAEVPRHVHTSGVRLLLLLWGSLSVANFLGLLKYPSRKDMICTFSVITWRPAGYVPVISRQAEPASALSPVPRGDRGVLEQRDAPGQRRGLPLVPFPHLWERFNQEVPDQPGRLHPAGPAAGSLQGEAANRGFLVSLCVLPSLMPRLLHPLGLEGLKAAWGGTGTATAVPSRAW